MHTANHPWARLAGVESTLAHARGIRSDSRFVISISNIELHTMDIVEQTEDLSPLKFKVGGATLVFEKAEDWKYHLRNLLVRSTCRKVAIHY